MSKRSEYRTVNGRQIGSPLSGCVGFDVAGTTDFERAECGQVDRLIVDAADDAAVFDDEIH